MGKKIFNLDDIKKELECYPDAQELVELPNGDALEGLKRYGVGANNDTPDKESKLLDEIKHIPDVKYYMFDQQEDVLLLNVWAP